jgi:hypothetical protein
LKNRAKDYDQKKQTGSLEFNKTFTKVTQSFKKVPWTFPQADQYMRDGFSVMITNKKTKGYMVVDLGSKAQGFDEAFLPTVAQQHPGPISRSIFVIKKAEKADIFGSDNIIRYGQKVKIEVNPYLYRR